MIASEGCESLEPKQHYCNACQGSRWHDVLYETQTDFSNNNNYYYNVQTCSMIQCRGCRSTKLVVVDESDECDRDDEGRMIPNVVTYPSHTLRSKPRWHSELFWPFHADDGPSNQQITGLLSEIYIALQNGCPRLAAMGIRSLLEHVMIKKCGDHGRFVKNINAFENAGYISKTQREALESVLEVGHATIHRSFTPSMSDVTAALDITENIIESIYIVSRRNEMAFKDVPPAKTK